MNFLKRSSDTILYGALFLSAILIYGFGLVDVGAFIGTFGAIATIYYGSLKLKIENDRLFKELFKTFNERYDNKINELINELRAIDSKELNIDEKNIIIDYFNLCGEEFLWKTKKRIPADVWKAWRSGIIENMKIRQINELYDQETASIHGKTSYYGLYNELKNK